MGPDDSRPPPHPPWPPPCKGGKRIGRSGRRSSAQQIICSRQQPLDDLAVHVGQAEVAALEAVGQLGVVEAQQVQDRGVQVVDVDLVLDDVEAELVGLAVA